MQWTNGSNQWLDALSSADPTPGGGAAAAITGAMGCSLLLMAARTTLKRKATPMDSRKTLEYHISKLAGLLSELKNLAQQDAQAYQGYLAVTKLPKTDPARPQALQDALWQAACIPADTATACKKVLLQLEETAPLIDKIIFSDVSCARHLLTGAIACCVENIRANAAYVTQPERAEKLQKLVQSLL